MTPHQAKMLIAVSQLDIYAEDWHYDERMKKVVSDDLCLITKDYLGSRDAIIPVIEKLTNDKPWSSNPGDYPTWMFSSYLLQELGIQLWDNGTALKAPHDIAWLIMKATPEQLATALLHATGTYPKE